MIEPSTVRECEASPPTQNFSASDAMPAGGEILGKVRVQIPDLGTVEGLEFSDGVSQFCGIKYATIEKRWTFSKLYTAWPEGTVHDGTKLG